MASGWMTIWRLDTGEAKRFGKDAIKNGGNNRGNLGAISPRRKRRNANRALKGSTRELKNVWRRRISFPQYVSETFILCDFCAVEQARIWRKDVIGDKRNAQDARIS